jgi:hypothetical protein
MDSAVRRPDEAFRKRLVMKSLMKAGEFLIGLVLMFLTLLCIIAGGIVSLFEIPKYLRRAHK